MNNLELHFEDTGRGTPLLLIHGFPFSSAMWAGQLRDLATGARLLAPDLPGFGESPPQAGPGSVQAYAEDCVALLDALDILEPVVLGGLSMGGYVALAFARHFPERVAGLVLASTRAGADSAEGKANRDRAIAEVAAQGVAALVEGLHPKLLAQTTYAQQPEVAARLKAMMLTSSESGVVAALEAMRDRPDSTDLLSEINAPVLVIHGEEDQLIPIHEAEQMAQRLPNREFARIAGAGHLPNMEQRDAFNHALASFIARI